MTALKLLGIALLIAGTLSLIYKGFTYTKETHKADIGPIEVKVNETERVGIPLWAGVVMIAGGGGLLLLDRRKS